MLTLAIIGAGYVGLVTGACFAQKGFRVIIIENNAEKIIQLKQGQIPFYEPHLNVIVADAIARNTIVFVSTIADGLTYKPEIIFSCVGTPSLPNGSADLAYVEQAASEIGRNLTNYTLIVNKSTVPVGTAQKVRSIIQQELDARNLTVEFDVASNPEFLKEGDAVNDFLYPDRIVVGVDSEKASQLLYSTYKPFIINDSQFVCMNIESAELTKYASNAMLALRISFMNQLALLADIIGADIEQVKNGMSTDKRIGGAFLNAGIGYGGSCFPKDVKALIHMGKEVGLPMTLIQEVDNVNTVQRAWFINKIIAHYGPSLAHKTVGLWGIAFKPETDDIRCAPSIDVISELVKRGANVIAYDPVATMHIQEISLLHKVIMAANSKEVLEKSDCLVVLTEWKEFLSYLPQDFLALKDKIIFDGRNCYDPIGMHALGLTYFNVGRNSIAQALNCKKTKMNTHHIQSSAIL